MSELHDIFKKESDFQLFINRHEITADADMVVLGVLSRPIGRRQRKMRTTSSGSAAAISAVQHQQLGHSWTPPTRNWSASSLQRFRPAIFASRADIVASSLTRKAAATRANFECGRTSSLPFVRFVRFAIDSRFISKLYADVAMFLSCDVSLFW